jgi:hypothetical protein
LIEEALDAGNHTKNMHIEMGILMGRLQRWTQEDALRVNGPPGANHPSPESKLAPAERQTVLKNLNSTAYKR